MAVIQREYEFDSILLNEQFLRSIFNILKKTNPKSVEFKTEITVKSESERAVFEDLEDFLSTRLLPSNINSISIRRWQKSKKDKAVQFQFNIDPNNPYYRLVGYDHGKLATCEKELEHLFNQYKNWYYPLFRIPFDVESAIPFLVVLSFSIFVYSLLPEINTIPNFKVWVSVSVFIVTIYFFKRIYGFLFPFIDYQIKQTKRNNWIRGLVGTISLGLLINFFWRVIEFFFLGS